MTNCPSDPLTELEELEAQIDHYLRLARTDRRKLGPLMMSLMGSAINIAAMLRIDPEVAWRRMRKVLEEISKRGPLS